MVKLSITNLRAGEEVEITAGVTLYAEPVRVVVTGEYPHLITLRAFFRVRDPLTRAFKINEHNVTVGKAAIYCGDAVLRRVYDGEVVRVEVIS